MKNKEEKETLKIVTKTGEAGKILEALQVDWLAARVERSVKTEMGEFTDGKSNRSPSE